MNSNLAISIAPKKMELFHPVKNGLLNPKTLTKGSHKKVWWKCANGHEWETSIKEALRVSYLCPYCERLRPSEEYNLNTEHPNIAASWHPVKNNGRQPIDVLPGCNDKVWWQCGNGHEWNSQINSRVRYQLGCPYCSGRHATKEDNLSVTHPQLEKEWHKEKNDCLFSDYKAGSNKKVWWKCVNGHEWETSPNKRTRKNGLPNGCPYCSGKKVCKENSFSTCYPHLVDLWDDTKNKKGPDEYTKSSGKKVWWRCSKGHSWEAPISSIVSGKGCPTCSMYFSTSFPEFVLLYYLKKLSADVTHQFQVSNTTLDLFIPSLVIGIEYDGVRYHKDLQKDLAKEHLYYEEIANFTLIRIREKGCPQYIGGHERTKIFHRSNNYSNESLEHVIIEVLETFFPIEEIPKISIKSDYRDIQNLSDHRRLEKSLSNHYPEISKEWDYEQNGTLTPEHVTAFSGKYVWWKCKQGHRWWTMIKNRTRLNQGCPVCRQVYASENYNLSVTHPNLKEEWSPNLNGGLKISDFKPYSNKKVWWRCRNGHEWEATISSRTCQNSGCPFCSGKKATFENSFGYHYPNLSKFWHPNKNHPLTPFDVTRGSGLKVWWMCEMGHEFEKRVCDQTRNANTNGCYSCQMSIPSQDNSLVDDYPEILEYWHPTENGKNSPREVTANSGKSTWWLCKKGHTWKTSIKSFVQCKICPYCSGKKGAQENSLEVVFPELVSYWHPVNNGSLTPETVSRGSGKKVWWICVHGHEWEEKVCRMTKYKNCPYCTGKWLSKKELFGGTFPELLGLWHPSKNEISPFHIWPHTNVKVWWKCKYNHDWYAKVAHVSSGSRCPYCSGRLVTNENSFAANYPDKLILWHPLKNGTLKPTDITKKSSKPVWWKCLCGHEWRRSPCKVAITKEPCPNCRKISLI